tara:strand:- start:193 stop:1323 length:1131 start_codon:yes stop_codon:yes gene_type:complete
LQCTKFTWGECGLFFEQVHEIRDLKQNTAQEEKNAANPVYRWGENSTGDQPFGGVFRPGLHSRIRLLGLDHSIFFNMYVGSTASALFETRVTPARIDMPNYLGERLSQYQRAIENLVVDINDPYRISTIERTALARRIEKTNMVIYRFRPDYAQDRSAVTALMSQLSLGDPDQNLCADADGLSSIQVHPEGVRQRYIPYTDKKLNWHTDGYYHRPDRIIRTMLLHCVRPALEGGALEAIDHEIIYGLLQERDPRLAEALSQPNVMTIPENGLSGPAFRAECSGPVFFEESGTLRMRYTARKHNVIWKEDALTQEAVAVLDAILNGSGDLIVRRSLESGEGLICANVPHRRDAFIDSRCVSERRLMYRGRYTTPLQA